MSAGATQAACVPRPVRTPQAPMSARVPPAFAYPAMARAVKVRDSVLFTLCTSSCKQVVCFGASAQAKLPLILKLATVQHITEEGWQLELLVYYTVQHAMPSSTNQ